MLRGRQGRIITALITQSVVRADESLRTRSVVRDLTPEREWEEALRACGLSSPKIRALRSIAEAVSSGLLDLRGLADLDAEVRHFMDEACAADRARGACAVDAARRTRSLAARATQAQARG